MAVGAIAVVATAGGVVPTAAKAVLASLNAPIEAVKESALDMGISAMAWVMVAMAAPIAVKAVGLKTFWKTVVRAVAIVLRGVMSLST